jgi:S-formylglutathione hydrolase FrmB
MPQRFKMNPSAFFLLTGFIFLSLGMPRLLRAQFRGGGRRADLSPISLPGGSAIEFSSFDSKNIGAAEQYSIFLPPSYSKNPSRTYPVIYFLHGLNNDETSWTVEQGNSIQNTLEKMMLSEKLPEFIMVHPRGDSSFYCNFIDGSRRYEDLVTQELVTYVETRYRASKGRENRAIAGTSMGGYGALKIAMKYPDRYAAAAGQSPILYPGANPMELTGDARSTRLSFFANLLRPIFGDPLRQDVWDENNPLVLATKQKLNDLKIYFDYGTDDRYIAMTRLNEGCRALDKKLGEAQVTHVFREHPGEPHGWALVAAHLDATMPFLTQTFKK